MAIFDKIKKFDFVLFSLTILIFTLGLLTIYSTQSHFDDIRPINRYWVRQMIWFIFGLLCMIIVIIPKYQIYIHLSYVVYPVLIFLLILVLFIGREIYGARRWINLGYFSFQPSEFSKLALVLLMSSYYSKKKDQAIGAKEIIFPLICFLILMGLILKAPDLGTAMMLIPIFISIVFTAGLKKKVIIISIILAVLIGPLIFSRLKPYQRERIVSFFSPDATTLSSGYQQRQSMIAVGSGGFFGKGFTKGTQSKLRFLPKHHTDLVFPAFAEEWGFFGVFVLIMLYVFFILRILETSKLARDSFGRYFCIGAASMFFAHIFINIGMVIGLLPITGLPLPLMSYGGSFLLLNMVFLGIVINIRMRRFGD